MSSLPGLDGRVALVTGAARGIGAAVASRLVAEGVGVLVNDRDADACAAAVEKLTVAGGRAVAAPGDITDQAVTDSIVALAQEVLGGLDIVVNNAGITRDSPVSRMSDEDWRAVHDVVLWGAFCVCRSALPLLRAAHERDGRHAKVVNMSSSVGLYGAPGTANYASAKAGLIGLTKTLSREWARYRINVNALAPGLIAGTQLTDSKPAERPGCREGSAWTRRYSGGGRWSCRLPRVVGLRLHHRPGARDPRRVGSVRLTTGMSDIPI
jgi:3-oxoacyl-[acyl-carrier protein] reductase